MFKLQGSKQGWIVPSDFLGYVSDETNLVGSVTGAIIPLSTIFCSAFSISSLASIGTFLQECCTGGTDESTLIVYCPGIFPVVSKLLGNVFLGLLSLLISAVVRRSCEIGFVGNLWS